MIARQDEITSAVLTISLLENDLITGLWWRDCRPAITVLCGRACRVRGIPLCAPVGRPVGTLVRRCLHRSALDSPSARENAGPVPDDGSALTRATHAPASGGYA